MPAFRPGTLQFIFNDFLLEALSLHLHRRWRDLSLTDVVPELRHFEAGLHA